MDATPYLSEFQFLGSSVKNLRIKNDLGMLASEIKYKRKIDISHKIVNVEKENDESLLGIIELYIKINVSDKKEKYLLDLTIEGFFTATNDLGEADFRMMLGANGITTLYSIARAFIISTSSQTLAHGDITLPMFNVAAYSKEISSKEE